MRPASTVLIMQLSNSRAISSPLSFLHISSYEHSFICYDSIINLTPKMSIAVRGNFSQKQNKAPSQNIQFKAITDLL